MKVTAFYASDKPHLLVFEIWYGKTILQVCFNKFKERELFIVSDCLMNRQMEPGSDSDYETILRCQKGDIDAFEEIVNKYQKKMFNISFGMTGDYNEAAEAVQDAFLSAYRNIKGFKGESRFSTWLYSILMNHSKNRLKRIRSLSFREPVSLDDPLDPDEGHIKRGYPSGELSVLELLEKREVTIKVQGCIDSLDYDFKEVIVLRDMQGFSYEEITTMLKVSEGTVKSRLHRAREALKNCLRKFLGEL